MFSVWIKKNSVKAIAIFGVSLGLYSAASHAVVTFEGSDGIDATITNPNCSSSSCHGTLAKQNCTGTAVATLWYETDNATNKYNGVVSCASNIADKISASPSYGGRMPDVTGLPSASVTLFNTWITDSTLRYAAPEVTVNAATGEDSTGGTFNAAVFVNGAALSQAYFKYSTDSNETCRSSVTCSGSTINDTSLPTSTGGGTTSYAISRSISSLTCGTTYYYRAYATNSQGTNTGVGGNQTLTTDACSSPTITTASGGPLNVAAFAEDTTQGFSLSATDPDNGTLTWSVQSGSGPTDGVVTFDGGVNTGTTVNLTYDPDPNYIGGDSFIIKVVDESGTRNDTITVNMTVNDDGSDSPVISGTTTVNDNEDGVAAADGALTAIAVSVSALDPDSSPTYNWDVISPPGDGTPGFSVATGATPTLSYTPLANDNGSPADSFTIRVCDGGSAGNGNCDTQVITVNLTAQPDTPIANADTGMTVSQGGTTDLDVVFNDEDYDGDTLTPISITNVSSNITFDGVFSRQVRITHDGSATPGTASFDYTVQDSTGRMNGPVTVSITLTGINFPPTAIAANQDVDEGTQFVFDLPGISTDPENDTLTVSFLSGTTTANSSVSIISGGADDGKALYTHDGTDVALIGETDSFTYRVDDPNVGNGESNTATVTVNLKHVNDLPVAVNDPNFVVVAEGGSVTQAASGSILANDTDEENGTGTGFTVNGNSTPANNAGFTLNSTNGTFDFTHDGSETTSTSFTYTVNDGVDDSSATGTVTINVTPENDAPAVSSAAPTTVFIEGATYSYDVDHTDNDTVGDSYIYSIAAGAIGNMGIVPGTGVITWTVDRTGTFNYTTPGVTVRVTDDDQSTGGANPLFGEQVFTVITSPLDTDSDGIADYSDNCPTLSNSTQDDFLNDTQFTAVDPSGIPASGDVIAGALDANGFVTGGDICDEDDDDDGIPDAIEDNPSYPFLDSKNAADAGMDFDGDGLTNLEEYLVDNTGASMIVDSVGPVVTVPADVTVNSTGYLTAVDIGVATANDGNEGLVVAVIPVVNGTISCAQLGSTSKTIKALRPGAYTVTWHACDSEGNLTTADQSVTVKPLINTTSGQALGEGKTARFKVMLNGPVAVDVTVNYTVGGSATPGADHDGVDGALTVTGGSTSAFVDINILNDAVTEFAEDVRLTLSNPVNAALGKVKQHTILITSFNLPPTVDIDVDQDGTTASTTVYSVSAASTGVVLTANAVDPDGDAAAMTYDWSGTDNAIIMNSVNGALSNTIEFPDPTILPAGSHYVEVIATDDNALTASTKASMILKVVAAVPVLTTGNTDCNGDGVADAGDDCDTDGVDNVTEGVGDTDKDGIPDYLDDNNVIGMNVLQNQTGAPSNSILIETDAGLRLRLGSTAVAAGRAGILVSQTDLNDHAGRSGGPVTNATDDRSNTSGFYDFEIVGLNESIRTANVVIPLPSAIQANSVYRKYNTTDGWFNFVVDANNSISSAAGKLGVCPSPGSDAYMPGLSQFHYCVQLTIEDGGPNDADKIRNYVIKDPSGVALTPPVAEEQSSSSDGRIGVMDPLFLLIMLLPLAYVYRRQVRNVFYVCMSSEKSNRY